MPSEELNLQTIQPNNPARKNERRDAAENRQLILLTANRLFSEQGVSAVTMADIAKAAGVGKGTLYRRFANKSELTLALMDVELQGFQNDVMQQLRTMEQEGAAYLPRLFFIIEQLVGFIDAHLEMLLVAESAEIVNRNQVDMPYFWQKLTIQGLLQQASAAGEISTNIDFELQADLLLSSVRARKFYQLRQLQGYSPTRIVDGLHTIINGFAVTKLSA